MNTDKFIARTVGSLFILTMVVGMFDAYLAAPTLKTSLEVIYQHQWKLFLGAFLIFTMSMGILAIAIVLYPLLKKYSEFIAVGYLSLRIIECVLLLVGVFGYLFLIQLSTTAINAGTVEGLLPLFNQSIEMRYIGYQLAVTTLGLGSIFLCCLFYRTGLIPKFLSIWGLVGYILLTASGVLDILGVVDTVNGAGALLYIPGGVWEFIAFPAWLFIKGFNTQKDCEECVELNV